MQNNTLNLIYRQVVNYPWSEVRTVLEFFFVMYCLSRGMTFCIIISVNVPGIGVWWFVGLIRMDMDGLVVGKEWSVFVCFIQLQCCFVFS